MESETTGGKKALSKKNKFVISLHHHFLIGSQEFRPNKNIYQSIYICNDKKKKNFLKFIFLNDFYFLICTYINVKFTNV